MILQRFSQAILKQKWSTVVLELLVVVVGIFLGLQVDDWNEDRKLRQLESLYLDKLQDDLSVMQEELLRKIERNQLAMERTTAALSALEQCSTSEQARSDLDFALERYQIVAPFNYLNTTYDEMVASGALARIEDQGLKQDITYAFSRMADLNANQRDMRVSMPVVDAIVWKSVSYSVEEETGRPVVSYDMAALCGNTELRNAVVEMIDMQWDSLTGGKRALESVERVIKSLQEHSARTRQ